MDSNNLSSFLLPQELKGSRTQEKIKEQGQGISLPNTAQSHSSLVSSLLRLKCLILEELKNTLPRLLSLNPSRREAIAQHLDCLAGQSTGGDIGNMDASGQGHLWRWIEGPRSSRQNAALEAYFEEISLIVLGQVILLKTWSDRGLRSWIETDLGRINWALSTTLRPHVPLDREGWQITRPNLYSWYNMSSKVQREIWKAFEGLKVTEMGPSIFDSVFRPLRRANPAGFETLGYDPRFLQSIWDNLSFFGWSNDQGPLKRNKVVFSPTLRDGALVRTAPPALIWIGLEKSSFQLMSAELATLWRGPSAPPLWVIGTGLEVHTRDQLSLALGSPKPSLVSRIAELEACDLAIVFEEQIVRIQGRNIESTRFKQAIESLPYFKKLKAPGTSLGDLQACVALSKLRPGGLLWWAREEPLSTKEGKECLNFLLERAKIVFEWDFSELGHSLPVTLPLYPKHLYLMAREVDLEKRISHRPARISVRGQIRSHIELPVMLEDAFKRASGDPSGHETNGTNGTNAQFPTRGQWQIQCHRSPSPQKDWADHWPDPTSIEIFRVLEKLRNTSVPLANITTIQPSPPAGEKWYISSSNSDPLNGSLNGAIQGILLHSDPAGTGRQLIASDLPQPGDESNGTGFIIFVPDESWIAPLRHHLVSGPIKNWLDYHAERRGERWVLNEQIVKWIPVPKTLLQAMGLQNEFPNRLPGRWDDIASQIPVDPKAVSQALGKVSEEDFPHLERIHTAVFVKASRTLENIKASQNHLLTLVTDSGRIRWRKLLDILPSTECVSVPFHSKIRITGNLPPHIPISRIERVKSPTSGILLVTESGFFLHLGSEIALVLDVLWEQVEGLKHPTWSELLNYLRLPRRIELAESTASEVLLSHGKHSQLIQDLHQLISTCKTV